MCAVKVLHEREAVGNPPDGGTRAWRRPPLAPKPGVGLPLAMYARRLIFRDEVGAPFIEVGIGVVERAALEVSRDTPLGRRSIPPPPLRVISSDEPLCHLKQAAT